MNQDDHDNTARNEPVSKTTMTLTMVHPASMDPSTMTDADVINQIAYGEFVGARTTIETVEVDDRTVDAEVEALGGVPGTFREKGPFVIEGSTREA